MNISVDNLQREFDVAELCGAIRNLQKVWSWGARNWTNVQGKGLAFRVSGFKFKGNVLITLNWADLFDVQFFNVRGTLKDTIKDVFVGDLIDILDERIELTAKAKEMYKI